MKCSAVLAAAGFTGDDLATALGVAYAESQGYTDAVGDTTLVNEKWGPSIGLFQIRSLRHPEQYPRPDNMRYADKLRDVTYNASTAYAIFSKYGWKQWSTYNSGSYKKYAGKDYALKTGHSRAGSWNL